MLSGTINLGLAVAQGFKFIVCKMVSPRQGIRAFRKGSDSKNTLGWTKSMLGMFSQIICAKLTLRISLSCSRVNDDGGISFSYQYLSPEMKKKLEKIGTVRKKEEFTLTRKIFREFDFSITVFVKKKKGSVIFTLFEKCDFDHFEGPQLTSVSAKKFKIEILA